MAEPLYPTLASHGSKHPADSDRLAQFISPECFEKSGPLLYDLRDLDRSGDVFCLGTILWEIARGEESFKGEQLYYCRTYCGVWNDCTLGCQKHSRDDRLDIRSVCDRLFTLKTLSESRAAGDEGRLAVNGNVVSFPWANALWPRFVNFLLYI